MAMASAKRQDDISLRPRNISVPSYRPIQKDGGTVTVHQLVPGSGEGQHTGTVGDHHRRERRSEHSGSLLPRDYFPTIAYLRYAGEGASYIIKAVEPTPYSLRFASASGRGSPRALARMTKTRLLKTTGVFP
jgi:hypothetical protein